MNAGIAGELIAKFVEKQWPMDSDAVYDILRLAVNKGWQEGKWLGMTAEFFVPVYKDRANQSYIIAPTSHPILLALNSQEGNLRVRDKHFMFHRNGYGDIRDYAGCKWSTDVYDLGEIPYFDKNNINFAGGVRIGVRAIGPAGADEKIYINGNYADGNSVFTYRSASLGECCGKTSKVDTVNGVALDISSDFNYINNINFTAISSITKTVTKTPVEVLAIDSNNKPHLIATLAPNQRFSKYRKYLVPNELCGRNCLHGLFKIGQQEKISNPTDSVIISNEEAIIALAKGVYMMYYKEQAEAGASYILQGLSVLEKEKREEESPSEYPIQVDGIYDGDLPESLKYNS